MESRKIKVGVLGAGRGRALARDLIVDNDAELVAVCDKYAPVLARCRAGIEKMGLDNVAYYSDFEDFFKHDMDAVVLANYAHEHAPYAVRFLRSGRHVLSEVLACATMKEAVELIEAVESSGKIYAYAENYGYTDVRWEMRRRYQAGDIGELMYAEGEYIHDCTTDPGNLWHLLTYGQRDHWRNQEYSTFYCTHSAGPILQMTGLRPVKVNGFEAPNPPYYRNVGTAAGVGALEIVTLENGAMVKSVHGDMKHTHGHGSNFLISGTKGCLRDAQNGKVEYYLEGENTPYEERFGQYDPPVILEEVAKSGHGGADYYVTHYFVEAIRGDEEAKKNLIDIYSAIDMTILGILAYRSICNGNAPIDVPNLRNPEERDAFRNDTFCTFPEIAGDMYVSNNIHNPEPIPDEVYERQKQLWEQYIKEHPEDA